MDRGDGWATVHGVTKSQTQLSDGARTNAHKRTHTHTHAHTGDEILNTVAGTKCPKNVMT